MTASPAEAARREIWQSLVSLLASYAAAASLGGGAYALRSAEPEPPETGHAAEIEHAGCALRVWVDADGMGGWRMRRLAGGTEDGRFALLEDGRLRTADGVSWDLDQAAIEWIARLTKAAGDGAEAEL